MCFRNSPVYSYRSHRVDAREHRCHREEVVELAVGFPEVPLPVRRVDKVNQSVKRRHGRVRERQVEQKVVGHRAHPLVGQNDPDDDEVPEHGHRQHDAVGDRPEGDAPRRLHELVGVVRREVGAVVLRSLHPPLLAAPGPPQSEVKLFRFGLPAAAEAQSWRGFAPRRHCARVQRS